MIGLLSLVGGWLGGGVYDPSYTPPVITVLRGDMLRASVAGARGDMVRAGSVDARGDMVRASVTANRGDMLR
jgi:hypothetical protein